MASLTGTFTLQNQTSDTLTVPPGDSANVVLTKTGGTMAIRVEVREGSAFRVLGTHTADTAGTVYPNLTPETQYLRLTAYVATTTSVAYTLADVAGESVGGLFPISNGLGTTLLDVTDEGIESPKGTFDELQVDNLNADGNTLSATTGAVNITPAAGSAIVLDGTINVDAGVVTGATSITSTDFVGNVTGDLTGIAANLTTIASANTVTVPADTQVAIFDSLTVDGTLTVEGELRVCAWPA